MEPGLRNKWYKDITGKSNRAKKLVTDLETRKYTADEARILSIFETEFGGIYSSHRGEGYKFNRDAFGANYGRYANIEESGEINANPNDLADGFVWRLPPSSRDNPETQAIGESDRMTLRFRNNCMP